MWEAEVPEGGDDGIRWGAVVLEHTLAEDWQTSDVGEREVSLTTAIGTSILFGRDMEVVARRCQQIIGADGHGSGAPMLLGRQEAMPGAVGDNGAGNERRLVVQAEDGVWAIGAAAVVEGGKEEHEVRGARVRITRVAELDACAAAATAKPTIWMGGLGVRGADTAGNCRHGAWFAGDLGTLGLCACEPARGMRPKPCVSL